ncbi:copper resistance protein CopC, partial [Demequina sp. TTPB684]
MKSRVLAALTAVASAAVVMVAAVPAAAHTSLIDVQPAEGETVAEGTTVALTFSEALLELGTEMIVTDATGESFSLVVERPQPEVVAAELPALAAGPVTVSWRVVAGDGHPIEGSLAYDFAADAGAGDDAGADDA